MKSSLLAVVALLLFANIAGAAAQKSVPPLDPIRITSKGQVTALVTAVETTQPDSESELEKAREDFRRATSGGPAPVAPAPTPAPRPVAKVKPVVAPAVVPAAVPVVAPVVVLSAQAIQAASAISTQCLSQSKRPLGCVNRNINDLEENADVVGMEIARCQMSLIAANVASSAVVYDYVRQQLAIAHAKTDDTYKATRIGQRATSMSARQQWLGLVLEFTTLQQQIRDTVCSADAFSKAIAN